MALDQYKTQILLLHSQQSTLDNLCTGFDDQYSVHVATSGTEALNIFTETPVHVIVSAQDLPGMSGLDALREAKKRSPETIGILLAGSDQSDGLEALVGDEQVFQIVRGEVTPEALCSLIESATKRARLLALSESANDTTANVDQPMGEHIVMETSENGSAIISDGTGQMPALKPQKIAIAPDAGGRNVDVLVLTKDEEFLSTVRDSTRGLHNIHHAVTPTQAQDLVGNHRIGVLVTDAAMVGSNIEILTQRLRQAVPRLVAVVAGRRDDGELLMDLINRGQVYRFLLKPVSPGRARLAIEASVKHHLEAADTAFKGKPQTAAAPAAVAPKPEPKPRPKPKPKPQPAAKTKRQPAPAAPAKPEIAAPAPMTASRDDALLNDGLDEAFEETNTFTETMTGMAASVGKKIAGVADAITSNSEADTTPPGNPADIAPPSLMDIGPADTGGGLFGNPKLLGIAAAIVLLIAAGAWTMLGSDDAPTTPEIVDNTSSSPSVVESDIPLPRPATTSVAEPEPAVDWLANARAARDAGDIITPAGQNAIEMYVTALRSSPNDPVIAGELDAIVEQVFSLAEAAILEQRLDDASTALQKIQLARPDNSRLPFLSAQLEQLQLRSTLDDARLAIREGRFEDAGSLIDAAAALSGPGSAEVTTVAGELASARSAQRIDEVLALANSRLEQDRLISPSNNNARYYYELAVSIDPDNTTAKQGLIFVASKLVLQARAAIDAGQLTNAEDLLRTARTLDPSSSELAASSTALQNAKDQVAADRLAAEQRAARELAAQQRAAEQRAAEQRAAEVQRREAAAAATQANADTTTTVNSPAAQRTGIDVPASSNTLNTAAAATANSAVVNTGNQFDGASADAARSERIEAVASNADRAGISIPNTLTPQSGPLGADRSTPAAQPAEPEMVSVKRLTRINYVAPKYPRSAQRRNVTGSVDIAFTVQRNGAVADIEVITSNPGNTFDQAAMDAVAQWRFEPPVENGLPVEKRTAVRLAFNLQ